MGGFLAAWGNSPVFVCGKCPVWGRRARVLSYPHEAGMFIWIEPRSPRTRRLCEYNQSLINHGPGFLQPLPRTCEGEKRRIPCLTDGSSHHIIIALWSPHHHTIILFSILSPDGIRGTLKMGKNESRKVVFFFYFFFYLKPPTDPALACPVWELEIGWRGWRGL